MFEGEQLAPGSKGCSFYKALFLLAKGAKDISFIFTLLRGSMINIPDGLAGVDSKSVKFTALGTLLTTYPDMSLLLSLICIRFSIQSLEASQI